MAKFSDIANGTRALSEPETVKIAPDVDIAVRFRALAPFEFSSVISAARADAKAQGSESPEPGDPLYEEAIAIHSIAYGIVDCDSKSDDPKPYFDGGAAQIKKSRLLTSDIVAFLYEHWMQWVESVSLQHVALDEMKFGRIMEEAAVGNARPLLELRHGGRWNFTRTLAARYLSLLRSKSSSSSGSQETTSPPSPQQIPEANGPADIH